MPPTLSKEERQRLAREALALAVELGVDLEITDEQLSTMSLDEMVAFLAQHGVDIDVEAMREDVRAALRVEVRALNKGLPLDPNAEEQIGDKASKAVVRTAAAAARTTVFEIHDSATFDADNRPWDQQHYIWISVGEGVCPSCFSLHGTVAAMDQWESIGRPRDGATYCGENCRCKMVPCSADRADEATRREETRGNVQTPRGY